MKKTKHVTPVRILIVSNWIRLCDSERVCMCIGMTVGHDTIIQLTLIVPGPASKREKSCPIDVSESIVGIIFADKNKCATFIIHILV